MDEFELTHTKDYSKFIYISRYARWIDEENRRETWDETVDRYINFWCNRFPELADEIRKQKSKIKNLETMPSMRALSTAGPALEKDEVAGYNCSYCVIDNPKAFDEILYILMCGTGVGFSVERQYISKLPEVAEEFYDSDTLIVVPDSKKGWASSFRELISLLYVGKIPKWDLSKLRPAGAKLKTFGGRSSGPEPLEQLFKFAVLLFRKAAGRRLSSIECHDLVCKIAEIVVVGGVRRSALLSLSNLSDDRMRLCKGGGQWWLENSQRQLSNNSTCYTERPEFEVFLKELVSLYHSKSGERGIFSRVSAQKQVMKNDRREGGKEWGTNPCSEIILRPDQFCNLSEVIIRYNDSLETLKEKVVTATILGTLQSTLTNFKYLRKIWKRNTEEERLLGVSLTGIMDHPVLSKVSDEAKEWLTILKEVAIETNRIWAERLGIPQSAAITCVKPSGCRPIDALTTTDGGILTLGELLENHKSGEAWSNLDGFSVYQNDGSRNKIKNTFVNGKSSLIKIKLSYNMELESTPNHKWFVKQRYLRGKSNKYIDVNQWVRADELRPNDILDVNLGVYASEKEAPLIQTEEPSSLKRFRNDCRNIQQPNFMTPELAWLIGYFYGYGCLSPSKFRIRFIDNNISHLEKAQGILKNIFDVDANILKASENRNAWVLEKGSVWLYSWFIKNGFDKKKMEIPRKIRESSKESIISFYAGLLDSSGRVSINNAGKSRFIFTTAYDSFAKSIQDVAWAIGLGVGRSLNSEGQNFQEKKNIWTLTSSSHQNETSVHLLKKHSLKAAKVSRWEYEDSSYSLMLGKVLSTEEAEEKETFDVEVENKHWYYAGSVKSHNTVSQLTNTSSGIHARFSDFYIRRVRIDKKDPLCNFMINSGFPGEQDVMNPNAWVFEFPIQSPETSIKVSEQTALSQLEIWRQYQDYWCEHKPSCTVYYTDDNFMDVGAWIWKNFDEISGISFLPYSDHIYRQAPYEAISEEKFHILESKMPKNIDWSALSDYETEDSTKNSKTLACSGDGLCEIVDLL